MQPRKLIPVLLILCVAAALALSLRRAHQIVPQFTPLTATPANLPHVNWYYSDTESSFMLDTLWLADIRSRAPYAYLYDLKNRKTIGLLTNAWPGIRSADGAKLICLTTRITASRLQLWLRDTLGRITSGRIQIPNHAIQTLWFLNLHAHTTRSILELPIDVWTSGTWKTTPDQHYAYNAIFQNQLNNIHISCLLCDLEKETATPFQTPGNPCGWWNNHQLLLQQPAGDLVLYDVPTQKISPFITSEAIAQKLKEFGIRISPSETTVEPLWNGTNFTYTLIDRANFGQYRNSFLIRIEPADPALALIDPPLTLIDAHFPFHHTGVFNPAQTCYIDSAGSHGTNIYVYDVQHATTNNLPVKLGANFRHLAVRFYHDDIIYDTGEVWTMKPDGTQNTRLFPPPEN